MSDLGKKLEEITLKIVEGVWGISAEGFNGEYDGLTHPGGKPYTIEEVLAHVVAKVKDYHPDLLDPETIKQAFKDDYWIDTKEAFTHIGGGTRLLTGQEWYDRFIGEQGKVMLPYKSKLSTVMMADQEAAKKAAGIG